MLFYMGKRSFVDVIKFRILRWGHYPGLSDWSLNAITCILIRKGRGIRVLNILYQITMVTDNTDGLPSSYAQPVSLLTELWLFNQAPLFWGPSLLPGMHVWTDLKARAWTGSIRITREHAGNYIRGPHSWIRNSRGGNSNLCFIKFPRRFWCVR